MNKNYGMAVIGLRVGMKSRGFSICRCYSNYKTEKEGEQCHEYQKQNPWRSLKQFSDSLTSNIIYNKGKYSVISTNNIR